jgi:hypothetical protein
MDRLSSSDRKERHVAEVGHASHIACCVAPDVLVQERVDRGRHDSTVAAVAAPVNVDRPERDAERLERAPDLSLLVPSLHW